MNVNLSSFKTTIFSLFFVLITAAGWGQTTTVTQTFSATSGAIDANISFTTQKNTGTSMPGFTKGTLRLYASETIIDPHSGNSLTLTPSNGVTITDIVLYSVTSHVPPLRYSIGTAAFTATDPALTRVLEEDPYTLSGLNVTSSITIRNASFRLEKQARLTGITVTYTVAQPTLTINPTGPLTFSAFTNSAASPAQDVAITGANLTPDSAKQYIDAILESNNTTAGPFEFSSDDGLTWTTLDQLPIAANAVSEILKVRLKATTVAGTYTDKIIFEYYDVNLSNNITKELILNATVSSPKLLATPIILSGFTYSLGNGPSASQSFVLSGEGLSAGSTNALLVPGENWEISSNENIWVTYTSAPLTVENYTGVNTPIYVRLKAGLTEAIYNNASNDIVAITSSVPGVLGIDVTLSGKVTAQVIATALTANGTNTYTYLEGFGPSGENSYQVSGIVLTADLVVTAPAGYEVSKTAGSGFASSVSFSPASGSVASVEVFVRLKSGLVGGSYNGDLRLTTTGISDKTISLNGTVTISNPGNDSCANAIVLTIDDNRLTGTLRGATPSTGLTNASSKNDVWYEFTTAVDGPHTVSVEFSTGPDIDFEIFTSECPLSGVGEFYANSTNSLSETLAPMLLAGTKYYVRVIDHNSTARNFGIRVTAPGAILTVSETALLFGDILVNEISPSQSFNVNASYLSPDSGDLTVTAPSSFQISLDNQITWSTSGTIPYANRGIDETIVYVRYAPTIYCESASGSVSVSGANAVTQNVAVSGNGILEAPIALAATNITFTSFEANWDTVAGATSYELEISNDESFSTFSPNYGPKIISDSSTSIDEVTGLLPDTQYYYRIRAIYATCASANSNVIPVKTRSDITTYNGTVPDAWDNGTPTIDLNAVINGNFITAERLVSKTLTINSGNTLNIATLTSFTTGDFTNNGTLVVESDGNFVQTEGSINSGTGSATVKRNAKMKRLDYTYWGSPVAGQMLKAFSPGTVDSRFLEYNTSTDLFTAVGNPAATEFVEAKGYAIRASNYYPVWNSTTGPVETDYRMFEGPFTGIPHNGDQEFQLNITGQGYNLVGNPYPSNVDFYELKSANNIDGTAYFWTNINRTVYGQQGPNYNGENYATLTALSGGTAATNGTFSTETPTRYIKVGQGFIVKATAATRLKFTNAMRDAGIGGSKFINKGSGASDSVIDRFWLSLTTPAQNFNTILIAYPQGATNAFESNADAKQFGESSDSFYSQLDDMKLNIQGRQFPLNKADVVSVGMKGFETGNYKIAMAGKEGIFNEAQNVYLKDKQTNTITNLSQESYTFTANEGLTEGRFEIVYENDIVLGTSIIKKEEVVVYRDGSDFVVKSSTKKISEIEVYDSSGRLMVRFTPNRTEVRIDGNAIVKGVYLVKVNRNGVVVTKKIIK
ncbi:T9SS type A sorting domain-containing protein [Kaistella antarctica]|uniref:Por secretion system C-terminal sorting domain n=1 Tax=Kaistella antarctica TaxID=266748 RepID=A0A3S4UYE7_9FLAO|nr:T9SS type A sorting domain-containing protein [Kaistella antarctica]KEY18806.1 hypothetical protein HY04_10055 [Kaistella antarctica]SEW15209.1 Por secretion system C-terminal sorting domain-containing protein [Kaistella antarctica]VEH99470.1 Por secretion system C-terminal sorting domain [Kaistella antarctica]